MALLTVNAPFSGLLQNISHSRLPACRRTRGCSAISPSTSMGFPGYLVHEMPSVDVAYPTWGSVKDHAFPRRPLYHM